MEMTTTEAIERVLKEHPQSRQTGSFNTWMYLIRVARTLGINLYVNFEDLKKAPSPESILKIRRTILNKENRYGDEHIHYEEGVTYEPKKKEVEDGNMES